MVKRLTQLRQIDCTCPRNYQALESHWDVKRYKKKKKKKKEASIVSFNPLIMNLSFISCRNEKRVIEAATTVIYARDRMAQSSLTHNDII